jgi:hypothetical protein
MPSSDLEQFCNKVLHDTTLQEKLRNLGPKPDFPERLVEAGALRGFEFSADDVREAMRANYSIWLQRWI